MDTVIKSNGGVAWYIAWGIYATIFVVGAVDLYLLYALGESATITTAIRGISQRYPVITLLVGIVLGHLFWSK